MGRILAICLVMMTACYSPAQPDCGFLCNKSGECPTDYFCAGDGVCHRLGTPTSLVCMVDARVDAPRPIDAPPPDADLTPPTVYATVPANGDTNVALDAVVRVEFNEPVLGVTTSSFFLMSGGSLVPGTIATTDAWNVTFTPNSVLPASSTIDVTLTSGITDTSGNFLIATQFSFQTGT